MKKLLFIFALLFCIQNAKSQEIKATVQCVAPRVQISDKQILTTLQNSIQQFITTRRWTEEKIETNEKIEISLFFDITAINKTLEKLECATGSLTRQFFVMSAQQINW